MLLSKILMDNLKEIVKMIMKPFNLLIDWLQLFYSF